MRSGFRENHEVKIVIIKDRVGKLNHAIARNLLFMHAKGGCDSISATFGQKENFAFH